MDTLRPVGSVFVILAAVAAATATPVPKGEPAGGPTAGQVRQLLERRYPVKAVRQVNDFQLEPRTEVRELSLPALRRAMPGVRFFRTELGTPHLCYPVVQVAVLARIRDDRLITFECFSPVFTTESPDFVSELRRAKAAADDDRRKLGHDIAELFRAVTHQGRLADGRLDSDGYRVELWHDHLHWRQVVVSFDRAGAVASVELKNPRQLAGPKR